MNIIGFDKLDKLNDKTVSIFLHIPKTGGSTLNTLLSSITENYYRANSYSQCRSILKEFSRVSDKKNIIISGHMTYGIHQYFKHMDCSYISLFRDPLERLASHYRYDVIMGVIDKNKTSLADFINMRDNNVYQKILGRGSYEKAKDFLVNDIALFGLQEKYSEYLFLLGRFYRLDNVEVLNKNISKSYEIEILDRDMDYAAEILREECEFYDFAKDVYSQRYSDVDFDDSKVMIKTDKHSKTERYELKLSPEEVIKKSKREADFIGIAIDNAKQGNYDEAEKFFLKAMELENNNFNGLMIFYYNHNIYKFVDFFRQTMADSPDMLTEDASDINDYIFSKLNDIRNYIIKIIREDNTDCNLLDKLVRIYDMFDYRYTEGFLPYLCKSDETYAVLKALPPIKARLDACLADKLGEAENLLIGGTGRNADIVTNICTLLGIDISGYLDDETEKSSYLGKKVFKYKDISESDTGHNYCEIEGSYHLRNASAEVLAKLNKINLI